MPRGGKHVGASARYKETGEHIGTWEKGAPTDVGKCVLSAWAPYK